MGIENMIRNKFPYSQKKGLGDSPISRRQASHHYPPFGSSRKVGNDGFGCFK